MENPPEQAAHTLFRLIPPAIAPDFLEEYGLTVSASQAQALTKEILLLSTYWVKCALRVGIPQQAGHKIWEEVQKLIREGWGSKFGFVHSPIDRFFIVMETHHATWDTITKQGGEPIAVFSEAARDLEDQGIVSYNDQQKLLALFLDLVPVEEIGAVATEIEQALSSYGDLPF